MAARVSPRLALLKSLRCSREQTEAQRRCCDRNTPDCAAEEPFGDIMCTYQRQIPQDWRGDLGCSCFLLVVQRKLGNDGNYRPSDTSLGCGAEHAANVITPRASFSVKRVSLESSASREEVPVGS